MSRFVRYVLVTTTNFLAPSVAVYQTTTHCLTEYMFLEIPALR